MTEPTVCKECKRLGQGMQAALYFAELATQEMQRAEADAERLAKALRGVEFVTRICPWCRFPHFNSHRHDCPRQAALAAHDAEEEEHDNG